MVKTMLEELRRNAEIITIYVKEKGIESDEIKKKIEYIREVKETALGISDTAIRHGLQELKKTADGLPADNTEQHLKDLIYLVIDGVDPKIVEEIAWNKYYVNCYSGFGGLEFIIYMYTCLAIQQETHHCIIEAMIDSMIPDVIRS